MLLYIVVKIAVQSVRFKQNLMFNSFQLEWYIYLSNFANYVFVKLDYPMHISQHIFTYSIKDNIFSHHIFALAQFKKHSVTLLLGDGFY